MPRPQTRVGVCQTSGLLRSELARLLKRIPSHETPPLSTMDRQDNDARYWIERARNALDQMEKAWDDAE